MESDISETFAAWVELVYIVFDTKRAYDTTRRYGIVKVVHENGIRGNMANFIMNLLKERQFRTHVADVYSSPHEQQQGVPQGSVLSCCLFALELDKITTCAPVNFMGSLNVDDFLICKQAAAISQQ